MRYDTCCTCDHSCLVEGEISTRGEHTPQGKDGDEWEELHIHDCQIDEVFENNFSKDTTTLASQVLLLQ